MTLRQAVDFIKRLSHKGDVNVTDDDITQIIYDCINMARKEVQKDVPNRYLVTRTTATMTVGTSTISLASGVIKPLYFFYVRNNQRVVLNKILSLRDFYNSFATATNLSNAPPINYVEREVDSSGIQQIELYPTPDSAYTMTYGFLKNWSTELLGSGQLTAEIPELPFHYHDSVAIGGLFYFLNSFDSPQSLLWEKRFEKFKAVNLELENYVYDEDLAMRLTSQSLVQH